MQQAACGHVRSNRRARVVGRTLRPAWRFLQDMTRLPYLNEPGVLWNLKDRYRFDDIYTYTGSILIAVNPFQPLPHMYGTHMMDQYRGAELGELSPHVYAIADAAYRQMRKEMRGQSILVGAHPHAHACMRPHSFRSVRQTLRRVARMPRQGGSRSRPPECVQHRRWCVCGQARMLSTAFLCRRSHTRVRAWWPCTLHDARSVRDLSIYMCVCR